MKQIVFAAVFTLFGAVHAFAIEPQKMREVLELIGFDHAVAFTHRSIKSAGQRAGGENADFQRAWDEAAEDVFSIDKVFELLVQTNAESFSEADYDELMLYFSDGLGRRVTDLENAAQSVEGQAEMADIGMKLVAKLFDENPERLRQIKSMNDELDTEENAVAAAMNFGYALMVGMTSAQGKPSEMTDEEILNQLRQQEPALRSRIRESLMLSTAYTYRDLTNEDMDAYIGFLQSPVGRKLYQKVEGSRREIMRRLVLRFGQKVMERMGVREL
ncbi:MAG: hypothetical protein GY947_00305 [Rhodobacteraceae bacterium]|nr:hypothetical protein [Paracoccaceae bacterium]